MHVMLGEMNQAEIDGFLSSQVVGRIGCHADGETYIIPMSYVYENNSIYCHSQDGKKLKMMRQNPRVCFEVYEMTDMANWRSVLIQGDYEELQDKTERAHALHLLMQRNVPVGTSATHHMSNEWPFEPDDPDEIDGIVFRIVAKRKTGTFEYHDQSPAIPG